MALNKFAHKIQKRIAVFSVIVVTPIVLTVRNDEFYLSCWGRIPRRLTFTLVTEYE